MDFDRNLIKRCTKFHGNKYEGQVDAKGQKCGIGRLILYGHIYEGLWKDDKQCGYGRQIYENGKMYEGIFKDDQKISLKANQQDLLNSEMGKLDDRDDQDIMKEFMRGQPPEGNKINFQMFNFTKKKSKY